MIVGTAGHIDHGKTALVRALTGVHTDRLKEEKARGISIELGYAYLPLDDVEPASSGDVLGFVDVPGHERFIHHMLAGSTGVDFVLLVVAVDDGPMPQTREHVQILDLLGLSQGLVALTKIDRVSPQRVRSVEAELKVLLAGTGLAEVPMLPVSSITGEGIAALKQQLIACARNLPPRAVQGHFRLAIDRCFTLPGTGTIVTGTAHAGRAQVGDTLMLSPPGIALRVRSIHAQNRAVQTCQAGQRCALNVTGLQFERNDVQRGHWVLGAAVHQPTSTLDVLLRVVPSEDKPLRAANAVHVHLGAEHVTGRLALLEGNVIAPGQPGLARLTLARPIGALAGDRYIVRDAAASRTLGGGQVLDPFPPARGRSRPERLMQLHAAAAGGPAAALAAALEHAPTAVDLRGHAVAANLTADETTALYSRLGVVRIPASSAGAELGLSRPAWQQVQEQVLQALREEHVRAPGEAGPTRERLRKLLVPTARGAEGLRHAVVFEAALTALRQQRLVAFTGRFLHLPEHRVQLSADEVTLWQRVRPLMAVKPLAPPRTDQLARQLDTEEAIIKGLLDRTVHTGEAAMISADRYYLLEAVLQLAAIVKGAAHAAPAVAPVTAAQIRDLTGIGRNIVILILEFFDRVGYTRRAGDAHWLRDDHADLFDVEEEVT